MSMLWRSKLICWLHSAKHLPLTFLQTRNTPSINNIIFQSLGNYSYHIMVTWDLCLRNSVNRSITILSCPSSKLWPLTGMPVYSRAAQFTYLGVLKYLVTKWALWFIFCRSYLCFHSITTFSIQLIFSITRIQKQSSNLADANNRVMDTSILVVFWAIGVQVSVNSTHFISPLRL